MQHETLAEVMAVNKVEKIHDELMDFETSLTMDMGKLAVARKRHTEVVEKRISKTPS